MGSTNYVKALTGAHILFIRDNHVFLIRRANTGFGDGLYSVPAGHVDDGELIQDAAVREAKEEAGVVVDPTTLSFAHIVHVRKLDPALPDRMQFFFVCTTWEGEPQNLEPEKCDHADWFPINDLPEVAGNKMVRYVAQAIDGYRKGVYFSHLDE